MYISMFVCICKHIIIIIISRYAGLNFVGALPLDSDKLLKEEEVQAPNTVY